MEEIRDYGRVELCGPVGRNETGGELEMENDVDERKSEWKGP